MSGHEVREIRGPKQIRAQGIIPLSIACHQVRDPSSNRILAYECHLNLSRHSARTKFKGPCPSYVRVSHGFRCALQQQWRENKRLRRGHRIPGRYKVNNKYYNITLLLCEALTIFTFSEIVHFGRDMFRKHGILKHNNNSVWWIVTFLPKRFQRRIDNFMIARYKHNFGR